MRIRLLSDLHLETYKEGFNLPKLDADLVILAGDIHLGTAGLEWAAQKFKGQEIIYVAGNHEFYRSSMPHLRQEMQQLAKSLGVHFLDNNSVEIQGVKFFGTTLWTDFQLYHQQAHNDPAVTYVKAMDFMPDFRLIEQPQGKIFTPEASQALHAQAVQWLQTALAKPFTGTKVVISHHAPHAACIPQQYQGDCLSPAFASNLEMLLEQVDFWLHGHVHEPVDFTYKGARILANPGGYPQEFSPALFNPLWHLDI